VTAGDVSQMTRQEIAAILAMIASLDGRRAFGALDVTAWEAVIGHLRFSDARDAVIDHYRQSTQTLMPATLIAAVKKIRGTRIGSQIPEIPLWIDRDDVSLVMRWERAWYQAMGDGMTPDAAADSATRAVTPHYALRGTDQMEA